MEKTNHLSSMWRNVKMDSFTGSVEATAKEIRLQWSREYGLSEEEIAAELVENPPVDIVAEQKELDAVRRVKKIDLSWLNGAMDEIYYCVEYGKMGIVLEPLIVADGLFNDYCNILEKAGWNERTL